MSINRDMICKCSNACLIKSWAKSRKKHGHSEDFISNEIRNVNKVYNLIVNEFNKTPLTFAEYGLVKNIEHFIILCNCDNNSFYRKKYEPRTYFRKNIPNV